MAGNIDQFGMDQQLKRLDVFITHPISHYLLVNHSF